MTGQRTHILIGSVLALALHGVALMLLTDRPAQSGQIESVIASVSLNLRQAKFIEDVKQGDSVTPAPPQPKPAPPPPPPKPKPAPVAKPKPTEPIEQAEPVAATPTPAAPPTPVPQVPRTEGAPLAQAKGPQAHSMGSKGATPDRVVAYAALVNAQIAQHRPRGGSKGTVHILFTINQDGSLQNAQISHPSGSSRLDRQALRAVHKAAPFPPPPAEMSATQRTFDMPFHFK